MGLFGTKKPNIKAERQSEFATEFTSWVTHLARVQSETAAPSFTQEVLDEVGQNPVPSFEGLGGVDSDVMRVFARKYAENTLAVQQRKAILADLPTGFWDDVANFVRL